MSKLNIAQIRADFPILQQTVNGKQLVYLDNAATTHKPRAVIEAIMTYNCKYNGNPHRGAHYLGVTSTELYEQVRAQVKEFIKAAFCEEIVFTKNATEACNLVAYAYGMTFVQPGDEILVCISEHHSNLVPWQQVARAKGAKLDYLYLNEGYTLDLAQAAAKINERTKIVCIALMSNVLGTIYPVREIVNLAHAQGAVVVVDAAQSVAHMPSDVQALDADFFVFSGHKMLSPMGIGVLYGKKRLLEQMPPFLTGGGMVEYVEEQKTTFAELPYKFEAGTPDVAAAVGLAAAIDYLKCIGLENIIDYERELTAYALARLAELPYITVHGPADIQQRGPVISFSVDGCHPHDIASILDSYGIAIRAGHHCAQPLMNYLHIPATSRASFCFYNTFEEVDRLIEGIQHARRWLGYGS